MANSLLTGFTVWYSTKWLAAYDGVLRDGEADFIIASPQIGFIALEVKGGRVRREASSGRWTSRDRNDEDYLIEDPIEQAMKSKKVLMSFLLSHWSGNRPFIWNRHGVILPHASKPKAAADLGAAMPLDIFAFREDMTHLGARIMHMMLWQPEGLRGGPEGFGEAGMRLIERFYGRDVSFNISLKANVEDAERAILKLTDDQNRLLDALQFMPRAHFRGGAGTGKTTLALEKAKRAAAAGKSVLLLCFNRPLRNHMERAVGSGSGIEVMTFHELCGRAAREAGIRLAKVVSPQTLLNEVLPSALEDAVLSQAVRQFSVVLVDEAQDFRPGWLEAVALLLKSETSGVLYLFSDDNQSLYSECRAPAKFGPTITLCDNFRNARPVFDVSSKFYRGDQLRCRGPAGPEVRWIVAERARVARAVERQINILVLTEGFSRGDIALLTGCALENSVFAGATVVGEHAVCDAEALADGCITLDSVFRFKGLDSPVVILTEMDGWTSEPELPYVGLSRAKSLLIVIGSEPTLRALGKPL